MKNVTADSVRTLLAITLAVALSACAAPPPEQRQYAKEETPSSLPNPSVADMLCALASVPGVLARAARNAGNESAATEWDALARDNAEACRISTERLREEKPRNDEIESLHRSGAHVEAARAAERVAERAERNVEDIKARGVSDPQLIAEALDGLASGYQSRQFFAYAEVLYERALAIREQALVPDYPLVAASLDNLAVVYQAQARHADAEPLLKRSLAIKEKALDPNHPEVAQLLGKLAELYRAQGRASEAAATAERAEAIRSQGWCPGRPGVSFEACFGDKGVAAPD